MLSAYTKYRILEMLPGLSVWVTLVGGVVLSFVNPLLMIYFIILFDVYWVLRVINYAFYLTIAWNRFRIARKVNWQEKLFQEIPHWKDYHHVVFLTLYNESWEVVRSAIQSICNASYDAKQLTIVIAGEEREKENYESIVQKAQETFKNCFAEVIGVLHPKDLDGEIAGKGSNLHYAEQHMKQRIDAAGWSYDKVIITVFDIDTACHESYFAYLTYTYATHPNPTRSSYQPIALYNNNMWESPAPLRLMAFGTTFWIMTSLARQDALVTFSSHSLSFQALVDAGFHDKRIVSEDSRIFYQCLLAYNGKYEVTPLYIPVSMDTVRDDSWWKSVKNLYKQQRRWAWGVEHVPFLIWEFRKKGKLIPLWKKLKWVFVEWEGKWSWCVVAFVITVIGRLPMLLASEELRERALFLNAPELLAKLMLYAMGGMVLSALLSLPLLPKRPESHPPHMYLVMFLQWILLPISLVFASAIPAIDAVTHLMLGKYLGFNVSQKKRSKEEKKVELEKRGVIV